MASGEDVLKSYISLFNEGYYSDDVPPLPFIKLFLQDQTEANYNTAIKFFDDFISKVNTSVTYSIRIVATISDGTVWYNSLRKSTYEGFKTKTISENHNTRRSFMEVLFSNYNEASDTSVSGVSGKKEYRVCYRVGESYIEPMGVNGFSITL